MLVVHVVVSVFSYLGSYGIGTEIACMLFNASKEVEQETKRGVF